MIYLPAVTRRTTQYLTRVAWIAGITAALLIAGIAALLATGNDGRGALYAAIGAGSAVVVAAVLFGVAHARTLAGRTSDKLDRQSDKIDDLATAQRFRDYETGALAAEMADLVDTNRKLVAEAARWRAAERARAEVVEAMARVIEKMGLRVDELEQVICEVGAMKVLSRPERLTHR